MAATATVPRLVPTTGRGVLAVSAAVVPAFFRETPTGFVCALLALVDLHGEPPWSRRFPSAPVKRNGACRPRRRVHVAAAIMLHSLSRLQDGGRQIRPHPS